MDIASAETLLDLGSLHRGVERLCRVIVSPCLDAATARQGLGLLRRLAEETGKSPAPEERRFIHSPEQRVVAAAALAACSPAWRDLPALVRKEQRPVAPEVAPEPKPAEPDRAGPAPKSSGKGTRPTAGPPAPPRGATSCSGPTPCLALDVWQSAWGGFEEIDDLAAYLRRNRIREVYLNTGFGPGSLDDAGYRRTQALSQTLRRASVERIALLYAELNHDVGEYARFLTRYPGLGISTLADDSELTDASFPQFERNMQRVKSHGVRYAAYVTLENESNSGVSDRLRRWAVQNLDEAILMSYFSCDVARQQEALTELLSLADATGRLGFVKIAILLGSKSTGRERSCERELGAAGLPPFLADLHEWARRFPSYGGIVLETNRRHPDFDIQAPEPGSRP